MEIGVAAYVNLTLGVGILHEGRALEDVLEVLHIAGLYLGVGRYGERQLALLSRFVKHIVHVPVYMEADALVGGEHHNGTIIHSRSRLDGLGTHGSLQLCPGGRLVGRRERHHSCLCAQ